MQKYVNYDALRVLTQKEIETITSQGCFADDWNSVRVTADFTADNIRNCRFKGRVGIENDVYINNIGSYIANMHICSGAYVENTGIIETTGTSSFGVGCKASVINESGGREISFYPHLSAQIAYVMAVYRNRPEAIARLEKLIDEQYVKPLTSDMGVIGSGVKIIGCGTLRNVCVSESGRIEGASIISNSTIGSYDPCETFVGAGVKIYDTVVASGSSIDNGALLTRCFVGSAAHIAALIAVDSVFFANSECENGEFASVFAGPYTVSHHKSTLLIAGMFSFFNAGSGSNMSNHLFKSGPVHQGIFRRGCKLGSGSYMMMPMMNGAYTTVIGAHRSHPDTDDFPFSLLMEDSNSSVLVPGLNLGSCGTARDLKKWVVRDKRKDCSRDLICYDECNPFVAGKILKAISTSESLLMKEEVDVHTYKRVFIKTVMLKRGLKLYQLAKEFYLGTLLSVKGERVVSGYASADVPDGRGEWIDAAGLYMPKQSMKILLDSIEEGRLNLDDIDSIFRAVYANYGFYAYNWAVSELDRLSGGKAAKENVTDFVERSVAAGQKLAKMAQDDARRECDIKMSVGYGFDENDENERLADFSSVRKLIGN